MKKSMFIIISLALITPFFASAQMEQGRWFFKGGNDLTFDAGAAKTKADGTTWVNSRYVNFNMNHAVGFTVVDRLPLGMFMDISASRTSDPDEDVVYNSTFFAIGPFVRYYFADLGNFLPYGELLMGIGNAHYRFSPGGKDNELYLLFRIGPGFSYFFNDYVALDLWLGFENEIYRDRDADDPPDTTVRRFYPKFASSLGVIVML